MSKNTLKRPRLGLSLPDKTLRAVLLPMPLVPTSPSTCPGLGVGKRCNLNELGPNLCVVSFSKLVGKLMIVMAPKGHFRTHIPHPMHNVSEMNEMGSSGVTSIHSLPNTIMKIKNQIKQRLKGEIKRINLGCFVLHYCTCTIDGTRSFTLLTTLFGLAFVRVDDSDTC